MAEPFIRGPNGEIGIWTGSGYDFSAPASFGSDALAMEMRTPQAAGFYSGDAGGPPDMGPATPFYSMTSGGRAWSPLDDNYNLMYDGGDTLHLRMKSGDKEGTLIPYTRDANGNWVMQGDQISKSGWDTNTLKNSWMMLMPLAAGLGGYAAASALGATGAAAGAGGSGLLPTGAAGTLGGPMFGQGAVAGATGGALGEGLTLGGGTLGGLTAGEAALGGSSFLSPLAQNVVGGQTYGLENLADMPSSGFDWQSVAKDFGKQALKNYINAQSAGGGGGAGGSGYTPSSRGGFGAIAGAPNESSPVPVRPMPLGGLIPAGAENPVEAQAQLLAQTLAKKRGVQYG